MKPLLPLHSLKHIVTDKVPTVSPSSNVSDAISHIRSRIRDFDSIDYIYVVGIERSLAGVFSIRELYRFPAETPVKNFMTHPAISAGPNADPEEVAHLALKKGLKAVPIVDESGIFTGVVPNDAIRKILYHEFRRHIFSFAGIRRSHAEFDNTLEIPFLTALEHRLPWLVIGLGGGLVAAQIIATYESVLKNHLVLAAFIPLVVYIAGAVTVQLQALAIRDFAVFRKLDFLGYFSKQLGVVLAIALALSGLLAAFSFFLYGSAVLAGTLGIAVLAASLSALFSGLIIPYGFRRFGFDPANASGPIATIVQDILSILIYFAVATALLS